MRLLWLMPFVTASGCYLEDLHDEPVHVHHAHAVAAAPAPAAVPENPGLPPVPGAVWHPGHWEMAHDGGYVWQPGFWEQPHE